MDSAAWDKLYHHTLFREIRYPLGKICEDLPTTYRIALDAGRVGMLNKPLYNYFHRPGSITMAGFSAKPQWWLPICCALPRSWCLDAAM